MIVRSPVEDFSGVVANVEFVDGVGESDDPNAIGYFRRHGYVVEDEPKESPKPRARRKAKAEAKTE